MVVPVVTVVAVVCEDYVAICPDFFRTTTGGVCGIWRTASAHDYAYIPFGCFSTRNVNMGDDRVELAGQAIVLDH